MEQQKAREVNGKWWNRKRRNRLIVGLLGLALVALAVHQVWATSRQPGVTAQLQASGVIWAEEVSVATEFGGQVAEVVVEEGQAVASGDTLVRLDTAFLDAQIEALEAAVAMAEAGMAQAQAGARPGQIAIAEAQLAQAKAGRDAARQAVEDLEAIVAHPQEIEMQISVTAAQVEAARLRYEQAVALKDAVEIAKDEFEDARHQINEAGGSGHHKVPIPGLPGVYYEYDVPYLPLAAHQLPNQWWQAWVGVNAAQAELDGLETQLNHLYTQREHPQEWQTRLDEARSALAQAEAQVKAAQAQVDGLRAGATDEQIAALAARVAQARAGRDALLRQREMMTITAPMEGVVMETAVRPGEVAAQGATLLTIGKIEEMLLTVYVPENRIGQIHSGQTVQVTVDSFPHRTFEGQVTRIADQAEFTPRNVTTQEERVNLVFAVEIRIPNPDGDLKPGMPADVVFE